MTPDKLNNTQKANIDLVFFNRVPKVGSQTLMVLMQLLAKRNNFKATRDKPSNTETIMMTPSFEMNLVEEIMENGEPATYSKHVAYIDFDALNYPQPIYINMVRDPVERIISWFYYVRTPWYIAERKRLFPDQYKLPSIPFLKKDFSECVMKQDRECTFIQNETKGLCDHRRQVLFFCGQNPDLCM